MKSLGLMLVAGLFLMAGCGQQEQENEAGFQGTAKKVVKSFARNWELKRFEAMSAQTVFSREPEYFVKCMKDSPIRVRNFKVLSEEQDGDDYWVDVSFEITDIVSSFAACVVNAKYLPKGSNRFLMSPYFLGIERFTKMEQRWHVMNVDDDFVIDIGANGSEIKRSDNVMNFVLDASDVDFGGLSAGLEGNDRVAILVSGWMASAMMNLGLETDGAEDIMRKGAPLVSKAEAKLESLVDQIKEMRDNDL